MHKTKIGIALLLTAFCCNGILHAATLVPSSMEPPATQPETPQTLQTANEMQEPPSVKPPAGPAWLSKCVSDSRKSPAECSMEETLVLAKTRQLVASVVVRIQPDTHEPVMRLRVPVGLYLPGGLDLQIDDGKAQQMPLQTCDMQGCYAEMPIGADLLAALKGGKRLSITFQSLPKNNVALPFVLDNFADVFQKIK